MIVKVGATPVFVDVEPGTRNLDLAATAARIGPRTRAIMPTHLAGLAVRHGRALRARRSTQLRVIEDAALAIGSRWRGQADRQLRRHLVIVQLPSRTRTSRRSRAARSSSTTRREAQRVEALRFHGIARPARRHARRRVAGGKFNLPDVNARDRTAPARAASRVQRAARARSSTATSSASAPTRACELPHPRLSATRRPQLEHVRAAAAA